MQLLQRMLIVVQWLWRRSTLLCCPRSLSCSHLVLLFLFLFVMVNAVVVVPVPVVQCGRKV
jgi:hypothetical protein